MENIPVRLKSGEFKLCGRREKCSPRGVGSKACPRYPGAGNQGDVPGSSRVLSELLVKNVASWDDTVKIPPSVSPISFAFLSLNTYLELLRDLLFIFNGVGEGHTHTLVCTELIIKTGKSLLQVFTICKYDICLYIQHLMFMSSMTYMFVHITPYVSSQVAASADRKSVV